MESFFFYLATILESFIFQEINQNRLYYDAGADGYKVKIEDDDSLLQLSFLIKFIPLVNLGEVLYHIIDYNLNKNEIIKYLKEQNLLLPFTAGDIYYYERDISVNTCRMLADRYYRQRKHPYLITFIGKDEANKIYYAYDFPCRDVIILKTEGTIENLSLEEQKKLVRDTIEQYEEIYILKCGGLNKYYDAVNEGYLNPENIVMKMPNFIEEILKQRCVLKRNLA